MEGTGVSDEIHSRSDVFSFEGTARARQVHPVPYIAKICRSKDQVRGLPR
jgi:hypothetical protein